MWVHDVMRTLVFYHAHLLIFSVEKGGEYNMLVPAPFLSRNSFVVEFIPWVRLALPLRQLEFLY